MTWKRRILIHDSRAIDAAANMKLMLPRNIQKGDDYDQYSDGYLMNLLEREVEEVCEKMEEIAACEPDDPRLDTLKAELVIECGDVVNKLRFICAKHKALDPRFATMKLEE